MDEVHTLAENGFKEIILTGIHVASYGKDLKGTTLLDVIRQVQSTEGIERIRFSSVEPNLITRDFAAQLSQMNKVCSHFHLSLQSGCNRTLKRMNRKYDTAAYAEAVGILREYFPDVALTTDIIAGFPGETDEDFEESIEFAERIGFSKIHAFPYSPKKGTPAAVMQDQIQNSVKNERTGRLIALSDAMGDKFIEGFIGKVMPVLYEQEISENLYEGYTENYIRVTAESQTNIKNKILDTKILSAKKERAHGEIL